MLIEQVVQPEESLAVQSTKRKRKSVRFAEEYNTVLTIQSLESLTVEEMDQLWYTGHDFRRFKQIGLMLCEQSRVTSFFPTLLSDGYSSSQPRLDLWSVHATSQRGMEAWVAPLKHGKQRKISRRQIRQAVLEAQKRLRALNIDKDKSMDVIYKVSTRISEPARKYAMRLGLADFHAIKPTTAGGQQQTESGRRSSSINPRDYRKSCLLELKQRPSQRLHDA